MMRKLMIVATVAIVLISISAWALDDTMENRTKQADRYLVATPPKDMMQDAAENMALNLPLDQQQQFKNLITKHLDIVALEKAIKNALINNFSADELKALADFYGSPIGKSAMKKLGVYMAEVMPTIQAEMIKAQAMANKELNKTVP